MFPEEGSELSRGSPAPSEARAADTARLVGFRALSYWFSLEADDPELLDHAVRPLRDLGIAEDRWRSRVWPPEQEVERWRLGQVGSGEYAVWRDEQMLYKGFEAGDVLDHFWWAVNQRVVLRVRDYYLIHAAVLSLPGHGAVLLPGDPGSGKSSLTVALVQSGMHYLSDELAPIDPVTGRVHPFLKAATLKPGSYPLFPGLLNSTPPPLPGARQRHLTPTEMGSQSAHQPHDVRAVVFCQYKAEGDVLNTELTPGQLTHELTGHSLGLQVYGSRALTILERLARAADGMTMRHRNLDEAVRTVREFLLSRSST